MTREEAKELLPIIQAFAEGKTIQQKRQVGYEDEWFDVNTLSWDKIPSDYRIKPELKYRPFKTKEECWDEMLKHQPFGWIKSPNDELFCIDTVFEDSIGYKHSSCYFEEYFKCKYLFVDGTPFGIKDE